MNDEMLLESGFTSSLNRVTTSSIPEIIRSIFFHTTLLPAMPALDQISEGLQLFDVISLVNKHRDLFKKTFVLNHKHKLNIHDMKALYSNVEYSVEGSSSRTREECTMLFFNEFLMAVRME